MVWKLIWFAQLLKVKWATCWYLHEITITAWTKRLNNQQNSLTYNLNWTIENLFVYAIPLAISQSIENSKTVNRLRSTKARTGHLSIAVMGATPKHCINTCLWCYDDPGCYLFSIYFNKYYYLIMGFWEMLIASQKYFADLLRVSSEKEKLR